MKRPRSEAAFTFALLVPQVERLQLLQHPQGRVQLQRLQLQVQAVEGPLRPQQLLQQQVCTFLLLPVPATSDNRSRQTFVNTYGTALQSVSTLQTCVQHAECL